MDCVRITVQTPGSLQFDTISASFEMVLSELEEWFNSFFEPSIEKLINDLTSFFNEHKNSPFPVVAHVIPPHDVEDSLKFVEAMKKLGITFIDKKIHHIQQNKLILFHAASPPSNVPRILSIFQCFDSVRLFERFINEVLKLLFKFGITPCDNFVGIFKTLFFDKYKSFSYLVTILCQSLLTHYMDNDYDFIQIYNSDPSKYIEKFSSFTFSNNPITIGCLIKIRVYAMNLVEKLFEKFEVPTNLFFGVNNMDDFWKGPNFSQLLATLRTVEKDELRNYLKENSDELNPFFKYEFLSSSNAKNDEQSKKTVAKTRRSRQMALLGAGESTDSPIKVLDSFMKKVFRPVPEKFPNVFLLSDLASFDPRSAVIEMLNDSESENDTAIAYQLLKEQDARTINAADWLNAFHARIQKKKSKVEKAVALIRFQVAISELEYLGFIDKRTRKSGTFRNILRV